MSNKYAIRKNEFEYSGEYYMTKKINSSHTRFILDDKAEAEKRYKSLVVAEIRNNSIYDYDVGNGWLSDETYQKIDEFTQEKFGQTYEYLDEINFDDLSLDDVFEFANIVSWFSYQLVELDANYYDENADYYLLWINEKGDYFRDKLGQPIRLKSDKNIDFLENSSQQLLDKLVNELNTFAPYGELTELSDSPVLLQKFLEGNKAIISHSDSQLEINNDKTINELSKLLELNKLLKNQWFEIRKLTCNDFKKIS